MVQSTLVIITHGKIKKKKEKNYSSLCGKGALENLQYVQ